MQQGERFNIYTHFWAAILAFIGMIWLIIHSSLYSTAWKIVSVSIYGPALVLLYSISTVYHSIKGRLKSLFQLLDHCAIYLLIAASYTPFALVTLNGPWGWFIFVVSWGLCVIGVIQEIYIGKQTRLFSMIIYLVMGWLIIIALKPLMAAISIMGFIWLSLGGVIYTLGIIFFLLDEKYQYAHGIWHLFVIAGSICQYISILLYIP